jgi:hypothetical protein
MKENGRIAAEWVSAGGVTISDDAVLLELKVGPHTGLLERLALRKVGNAMAQRLGMTPSQEELNDAITAFYAEHKLFGPEQMLEWRHALRVDEAAINEYVRETMVMHRLRHQLVSDEMVIKRFELNPHQYARAEVEVFTFATEGAAREFILAVREKETEAIHGARRRLIRRETADEAGALIFSTEPGELAGPVEIDYECYEVFSILHREHPVLNAHLQHQIRDELFDEMLKLELARSPLTFLL